MEATKTEYSRDFNFFINEQIGINVKNQGKYVSFFSRLDGKLFKTIDHNKIISDDEILEISSSIHLNLPKYD